MIDLPPMTDRAKRVIALAQAYATELGHTYVGTEHLLIGILREGGGIGAGVAISMGIDPKKAETAVEFIVGRETPK